MGGIDEDSSERDEEREMNMCVRVHHHRHTRRLHMAHQASIKGRSRSPQPLRKPISRQILPTLYLCSYLNVVDLHSNGGRLQVISDGGGRANERDGDGE